MLKIVKTVSEYRSLEKTNSGKSIGFVATMGNLHSGHLSLIEKSKEENDITVVSIFVNPTQFNDSTDFEKYPLTFDSDLELLKSVQTDYLFFPSYGELYPDSYRYKIIETELSNTLCGKTRPGHFDGVLTVVMKLLNIINPDKAYFGEKDYQQYLLIRDMAKTFFLKTEIVALPLIRDIDDLALSSRNNRLTEKERKLAPDFNRILKQDLSIEKIKVELLAAGFKVDYVEKKDGRVFGAVFLGEVRLIDNV